VTHRRTLAWFPALATVVSATPFLVVAQAPVAAPVVKVAGDSHKVALRSDGTVVGWGGFRNGQLGPIAAIVAKGLKTTALARIELPGKAIDVAAGSSASYAVLEDGSVWAWGRGDSGQLGTGSSAPWPLLASSSSSFEYRGSERPVRVAITNVARIEAAGDVALALLRDGTTRAWGARSGGLPGDGRQATAPGGNAFMPVAVMNATNITSISMSASHALALTSAGHVLTWGGNGYAALGRETPQGAASDSPSQVPGLTDVVAVAAAGDVSTVVKRDGTVWVWGSNGQGQFGNGSRTSHPSVGTQLVPQMVPGVTNVAAIATGTTGRHTLALLKDGTLRGWGNTDFGQLGAGMTAGFQLRPVTPKIAGVKAVFAIGNNSYAITNDNTFWAWGIGGANDWPLPKATSLPERLALE
jgi:alpha-tubulin suppressor-like RCC1 family protein